jgi:hypothetical protein
MIGQLYNSDFSIGVYTCDFESPGADFIPILWIQTVVTAEFLNYFFFPIYLAGKCVWHDLYRLRLANKRAGQFADYQVWRVRGGFFVLCIVDPQHISCILYQSMLKASSGSHKGPAVFTAESNGLQCPVHAFVRAARSTPKSVKLFQCCFTAFIFQWLCW